MTIVCDLDGVVWRGERLIEGSGDALRKALHAGVPLLFATNNSTRTPSQVKDKLLHVAGVEVPVDSIVNSSQAAASMVGPGDSPVLVFGSHAIEAAMRERSVPVTTDPDEAQAVVVGLDRELTYQRLSKAMQAVLGGARFIATNVDPTFPTASGIQPGGGAIVAALSVATGVEPEVAGKPYPPMRHLLREAGADRAWVIGDRVDTDVAMAAAEPGWRSILVGTGVTDLGQPVDADHVASDLAEAVGLVLDGTVER